MPQIVSNVTGAEHRVLGKLARMERRSLGNQLLAMAFEKAGLPVPTYVARAVAKTKGGKP